ncbi:hypothetical protein [Sphingomonas mucosissima]|uniref:Uncharacterized protein n=1 Tax=Sphingomonas mucosissima TaxID=370959 RepID=A0A245ZRL1_9SPHN|nr:hypothetical protein [Sphingomonas mucosissima]OWK32360.1 hypothetical protein SPMU_06850 [Sphingomonas mucosissima]
MTSAINFPQRLGIPVRVIVCGAALLLGIAGCGGAPTKTQASESLDADTAAGTAAQGRGDERVGCALAQASPIQRVCQIEQSWTDQGLVLTIRHPDGGFRRLRVVEDGRGLVAADGAEPARVTLVSENEIDVLIGNDHYRLPATRRASGQ